MIQHKNAVCPGDEGTDGRVRLGGLGLEDPVLCTSEIILPSGKNAVKGDI